MSQENVMSAIQTRQALLESESGAGQLESLNIQNLVIAAAET
jgi:hypothetical protein